MRQLATADSICHPRKVPKRLADVLRSFQCASWTKHAWSITSQILYIEALHTKVVRTKVENETFVDKGTKLTACTMFKELFGGGGGRAVSMHYLYTRVT